MKGQGTAATAPPPFYGRDPVGDIESEEWRPWGGSGVLLRPPFRLLQPEPLPEAGDIEPLFLGETPLPEFEVLE